MLTPISQILPRLLRQNPGLEQLIESLQPSALTEINQQLPMPRNLDIEVLNSHVKLHIPTSQFEQAKPHLQSIFQPLRGFNIYPSLGGWLDDEDQWVIEDIQLVTAFAPWQVIRKSFLDILQGSYDLGKAIQQSAIALEVNIPAGNWMLIIPTK